MSEITDALNDMVEVWSDHAEKMELEMDETSEDELIHHYLKGSSRGINSVVADIVGLLISTGKYNISKKELLARLL